MSGPSFRTAAAGTPVRGGEGAAVEVRGLVKRYPGARTSAVDGVSFLVRRGEVFGLLGPNGAGKSTTVGVLTTRVRPTSGEASVAGVDVARDPVGARSVLAVVPQRVNLDLSLSIRRDLLFRAAYHKGDCAQRWWCAEVEDALEAHWPDVTVANVGAASFSTGEPTTATMTARGVEHLQVVALRMEALNHCPITRTELARRLWEAGLLDRVNIPWGVRS